MTIQPIDIPSLFRALACPVFAGVALTAFRRQIGNFISVLGQRASKLSFGKFSIEMAKVEEMKPSAMDTEIRQLEAGLNPQGDKAALVNELQRGKYDYIVIDLGSESSPRWLTSRLYLLCFLISLINRKPCIVFVETANGVRKNFIGTASPDNVRWALARKYSWLESAAAAA